MQVRHVFLSDYDLVLSLLKLRGFRGILEQKKKKKSGPNKGSPLNSSIDNVCIRKPPP